MNCNEARDLVTEALAAPLPRGAAADLEAHLATCDACRLETADLRRVWKELERLPEDVPGEDTRTRFAAMLEAEVRAARRRGALRRWAARGLSGLEGRLERWLPHRALAQAAVAVGALALGLLLGAGHRFGGGAAAPTGELAGLRQEVRSLSELVTLSLLKQDSASERLRGVSFGRQSGASDDRVLEALLDTLRRDSDVNVRLAAVDALAATVGRPMVRDQLLHELQKQRSPMVQIALIDVLLAHDRDGSRQRLLDLAADPSLDPAVRDYLRSRLHQLS
jgi:HEAT repeat protein/putative zinc finger protein